MVAPSRSRLALFTSLAILFYLAVTPIPAVAGIVTTAEIMNAKQIEQTRAHLHDLLARKDVRMALIARGVDVTAAQNRVANMTDAEVKQLAANIDQLPAGGRLTRVETILLVIIIILLI